LRSNPFAGSDSFGLRSQAFLGRGLSGQIATEFLSWNILPYASVAPLSIAVHMASSKNGSVLFKKRARNDATVSSPISDNLTQDGRKRRKKHKLSSLGVTVDSTILSAPDQYKKSPGPVTGSGDLCRLL
jgi:hypothetical protein